MFQHLLAFLLINSYYQSLGVPIQSNHLISDSLTALENQCKNAFLSKEIKDKIKDCAISVPPYNKKQIRCLIFYDINKQLCSAVAASKLTLLEDYRPKIVEEQHVDTMCTQAKDWIFTNITEYAAYKSESEEVFKLATNCAEVCGGEEVINEANYFCKYYRWGSEVLKTQVITTENNNMNINMDTNVIPDPNSVKEHDNPLPRDSSNNPANSAQGDIKNPNGQVRQTEAAVSKILTDKEDLGDVAVQKSTAQTTSTKQAVNQENGPTGDKNDEADVNVNGLEHPDIAEVPTNEQANKSTMTNESKLDVENDPALMPESGRSDILNQDTRVIELDKGDGKSPDDNDYADSEGNDVGDDDSEDPALDTKSEKKQESFVRNKLITSHNTEITQKEFFPNTISDGFTDDGDHFFPFFLTAVILVVLLYVLYHNKSKVSKVFFGLILEGRQSGRRRNSRGHAYRRLDTLEQAMSANTAAPPSKIIY